MKFNCGKTWEEKRADLEQWNLYFAWFPVQVDPRDCRWLEWVRNTNLHAAGLGSIARDE